MKQFAKLREFSSQMIVHMKFLKSSAVNQFYFKLVSYLSCFHIFCASFIFFFFWNFELICFKRYMYIVNGLLISYYTCWSLPLFGSTHNRNNIRSYRFNKTYLRHCKFENYRIHRSNLRSLANTPFEIVQLHLK